MPKICCVEGCKSESYPGSAFSVFKYPTNTAIREQWDKCVPVKHTMKPKFICSLHFEPKDIMRGEKIRRLKPDAVPSIFSKGEPGPSHSKPNPQQAVDYGDGRVSPASDPEEMQIKVEQFDNSNVIMIQDPLTDNTWQGSYKQLAQSSNALETQYVQQTPTTVLITDDKIIQYTDYKTMYFKLQEEVALLKNQNQSLLIENQKLSRVIVDLQGNSDVSAQDTQKDGDVEREYAGSNKKLSDLIQEYTEKIRTMNEKYEILAAGTPRDQPELIGKDLTEQTQLNQTCTVTEHDNLMEKIQDLTFDLERLMKQNRILKRNVRLQKRRYEKLRTICVVKSDNIRKLKLGYLKLKSMYEKLKMLKTLQ